MLDLAGFLRRQSRQCVLEVRVRIMPVHDTSLPHRRNGQRVLPPITRTLAAQTKIKSRERKRKDEDDVEDDEPF